MPDKISSSLGITFEVNMSQSRKFLKVKGEMIVKVEGKTLFSVLKGQIKVKAKSLIGQLALKIVHYCQHFFRSKGKVTN